jgi:cytochrome c oxidase subunit 3
MLLFVATETMLFAGLVTGYIVLGFGSRGFDGMPTLPLGITPIATAVLLLSSISLIRAQRVVRRGSRDGGRWTMIALALGTLFLGMQAFEWSRMLGDGLFPGSGVNAGMLYVLGGMHALHVVGGLIILAIFGVRALRAPGAVATRRFSMVAALYWHFVTIVWITLFMMLFIL